MQLAGCVAAIPAVMMASSAAVVGGTAFGIYKVVQLETGGGQVEVGFQHPLPEGGPREAARALRRIAVWPTSNENAYLAERLARQPALTVTSPGRIRELMADRKEVLRGRGLRQAGGCRRCCAAAVPMRQTSVTSWGDSVLPCSGINLVSARFSFVGSRWVGASRRKAFT